MKKKILLVLLVVLMVGILAFSVFACNGDKKKDPVKNNNQTVDPDDEIEDVDYLTPMVTDVIGALDNTIATVTKIDKKASVSASIYVDVAVGEETYKVNLDIAGSIDQTAKDKNWAQIDANVLGVEVSLFAVNNGEVEDLYIAQNILDEEKEWNKLSQFEQANVLNNLACNSIIDLVKGIDATTKKQLSDGYINGVAGGILGMLSFVDGMNILVPGTGAGEDFATTDGYNAALNVGGIASLLEMDAVSKLLAKLPADYHGIISTAINLLLGADLKFVTDEKTGAVSATFTPGAAEDTPTIELGFAVKDDLFKGLALSYEKGDISVQFGINNISLSADSKAYTTPYGSTEPDELAIALTLGADLPEGIYAGDVAVDVNIYPNVKMTFDDDKYVALDLSGLQAVATAVFTPDDAEADVGEYVIAEYNLDPEYPEDIILNLECLNVECSAWIADTMFRIPVDLQSKFDKMIADEKASKAPVAQNAINGKNVVDYVIEDIVPGLFNEDGSFNIGAIVGVLGQVGAIVEEIKPILETEGLFSYELGEDEATASATLNLEVLMEALLVDGGIIDGITGDWNNFSLYNAEGEKVENLTLSSILAPDAVYGNIVALVNTLIYENYVENYVPANEGDEAYTYAEYVEAIENDEEGLTRLLSEEVLMNTLAYGLGLDIDTTDLYKNLTISVNGYAQDGIGFGIGATVGNDAQAIALNLGLEIIKNESVRKTLTWEGDKTGYASKSGQDDDYDEAIVYSNCTGNDGGAYLMNTLLKAVSSKIYFLGNYVDLYAKMVVPAAAEEEPSEEATFLRPFVGEHTVEITEEGQKVYFFFVPATDGQYLIEDPNLNLGVFFADDVYMSGVQNATAEEPVNFYVTANEVGTYSFVIQWRDAE